MITNAILSIVLSLAGWVILHFIRSNTDQRGKIEEQNRAMKEMLHENLRVKKARDAMAADTDDNVRQLLRDKYTRPKP